MKLAIILMSFLTLAGCSQRLELSRFCQVDDPASVTVVGWSLARTAERACPGGYDVLDSRTIAIDGGHEVQWSVDCRTSPDIVVRSMHGLQK